MKNYKIIGLIGAQQIHLGSGVDGLCGSVPTGSFLAFLKEKTKENA